MEKVTLKNYRCFGEEQTARLAPLTFLVGENSTGKTSFLALIRALWDVAFREEVPNFQDPPYNLGSFREITHSRVTRGEQAQEFEGGLEFKYGHAQKARFFATFEEKNASPHPSTRGIDLDGTWATVNEKKDGQLQVKFGDEFHGEPLSGDVGLAYPLSGVRLAPIAGVLSQFLSDMRLSDIKLDERANWIVGFINMLLSPAFKQIEHQRPFASAPVRSRPFRTYDYSLPWADTEGENIPTYLASIYLRDPDGWKNLKSKLEAFGQSSGLFDEISIKSFGKSVGTPFQVQIRKFSAKGRKGPQRNLIDVGYGVSQTLPLLSELLRTDGPSMFLLQQPEVHLHPSAQAALGSLFCAIAGAERKLIVETHSDHLLDRVRMEIRDKTTELRAEDVSVLYFEPGDLDVKIHSIRFDEYGNVLDAPPSYRRFFMEEVSRSVGIGL